MSLMVREGGSRGSAVLVQRGDQPGLHFLQSFGSHNPEPDRHILIFVGKCCCLKVSFQRSSKIAARALQGKVGQRYK